MTLPLGYVDLGFNFYARDRSGVILITLVGSITGAILCRALLRGAWLDVSSISSEDSTMDQRTVFHSVFTVFVLAHALSLALIR